MRFVIRNEGLIWGGIALTASASGPWERCVSPEPVRLPGPEAAPLSTGRAGCPRHRSHAELCGGSGAGRGPRRRLGRLMEKGGARWRASFHDNEDKHGQRQGPFPKEAALARRRPCVAGGLARRRRPRGRRFGGTWTSGAGMAADRAGSRRPTAPPLGYRSGRLSCHGSSPWSGSRWRSPSA